uniref:Ig-like domain-containing protein n=1 Tax=Spermophilus dauricus TaxID=99837 RepID=A0A8C9QEG8_SPEDA
HPPNLHYNLTVRSQGGSVQSRFFADCYWDHQLFLHYDSHDKESAKPQELWAEKPLGTESWDTEIWELIEHGKNLKATLAEINALQEQKGGSHSLQETWGCKTEEDNHTRGFWDFHYDGEPFLSYHPETHSWKVEPSSAQILAMEVKNSWDADDIQSKDYKAHVQGELCGRLRRYQVSWKVSPAVNVTCAEALEDTINMTCWAFGFYPQNISVTWLQDGEPRSQGTQQSWGVFPYVNGTYQTWVSIRIPQGQEQRFCCYVGYRRNNSTGRVSCATTCKGHSRRSPTPHCHPVFMPLCNTGHPCCTCTLAQAHFTLPLTAPTSDTYCACVFQFCVQMCLYSHVYLSGSSSILNMKYLSHYLLTYFN